MLTLKELVDAGSTYDGMYVGVYGYIGYAFEGCTIIPEDPNLAKGFLDRKYHIWYWNDGCMTQVRNFKSGYATLYGTYDMKNKGHLWSYDASLIVDRIQWRK